VTNLTKKERDKILYIPALIFGALILGLSVYPLTYYEIEIENRDINPRYWTEPLTRTRIYPLQWIGILTIIFGVFLIAFGFLVAFGALKVKRYRTEEVIQHDKERKVKFH